MSARTKLSVELPDKLVPVFTGYAQIRGAYGGRGSAKTRSFAKMTAIWGMKYAAQGLSGIILCGREFMNSLQDSSFEEVAEAIRSDERLSAFYEIGEKYIRSRCRRISYAFAGLRHNLNSIKSKARILLAWVDEAEDVSEAAWVKLLPTVREEGAEIWVTWNPERPDSATNKRFREYQDEHMRIVQMNYTDNPWFPSTLEVQRERDRKRLSPEDYAHVWEGAFLTRSSARVFHNWRVDPFETPEEAAFYFGADWGFSVDPTVLVRCFIEGQLLYVDREVYKVGCSIDATPALFEQIEGARAHTIRADSARPETIDYMKRNGFPRMVPARKGAGSVEEGVEFLNSYDIIVHPRCKHTIDELTYYSYEVDKLSGDVLPKLADKKNHVIDALRYAVEGVRNNRKVVVW